MNSSINPASLKDRLKTLKLLSLNPKKKRSIAKSGFYCNIDREIVCFACNLHLTPQELKKNNPETIHMNMEPKCYFLQRPRHEEYRRVGVPCIPEYTTYNARLASFKNWPIQVVSAEELSKNGFYYSGIGDKVKCYHCGSVFKHWEEGDDPLNEHAKGFPNCDFLRVSKGKRFVEEINNKYKHQQGEEKTSEEEDYSNDEEDVSKALEDSELCSICLEGEKMILLIPCGHVTCKVCCVQIVNCPICRGPISRTNMLKLDDV